MYQRQQNTHYPKGGRFGVKNNFLKLVNGPKLIIEGRRIVEGGDNNYSVKLDNARISLRKISHIWGKGYFAADGT